MTEKASYGRGCFLTNKNGILKKIVRKERLLVWNKKKCLKEMREIAEDASRILLAKRNFEKINCNKCRKSLETNSLIDKDENALCLQCLIESDEKRLETFEQKYLQNRDRMRSYLGNWC
jgi:hypothetical protein